MDALKRYKFLGNYYSKPVLLFTKGIHFLYRLVNPKSRKENLRRREFIFNVLLLDSIILSGIASIIAWINSIRWSIEYKGLSPIIPLFVFIIFLGLYFLSRSGSFTIAAYIFIATYFIPVTFMVY